MSSRYPARALTSAVFLAATLPPSALSGQASAVAEERYTLERLGRPALLGPAGLLGVNVLLGGASVGLVAALRGGSFLDGFLGGAAAGGLVFAGKTVAAQRFSGAGLAGRQLAALGGSVATNVGAGQPALARLQFPLGPVSVGWDTRTGSAAWRVDPLGLAVLAYAVVDPHFRLDAGATLSAGTPVFRGDGPALVVPISGKSAAGLELYSVILLADLGQFDAATRADILAHERVHTLQADAFQAFWGRALLEWLAPEGRGWQRVVGVLDINLGEATAELADHLFARRGLWEIEAEYIGR